MEKLPEYVGLLIGLAAILTIYLFWRSAHHSRAFLWIAVVWVAIQMILGFSGFYHLSVDTPPNLPLLVGPPTLLILGLFISRKGKGVYQRAGYRPAHIGAFGGGLCRGGVLSALFV